MHCPKTHPSQIRIPIRVSSELELISSSATCCLCSLPFLEILHLWSIHSFKFPSYNNHFVIKIVTCVQFDSVSGLNTFLFFTISWNLVKSYCWVDCNYLITCKPFFRIYQLWYFLKMLVTSDSQVQPCKLLIQSHQLLTYLLFLELFCVWMKSTCFDRGVCILFTWNWPILSVSVELRIHIFTLVSCW
jgi:hypothetical protein